MIWEGEIHLDNGPSFGKLEFNHYELVISETLKFDTRLIHTVDCSGGDLCLGLFNLKTITFKSFDTSLLPSLIDEIVRHQILPQNKLISETPTKTKPINVDSRWRHSEANVDFKLCKTYPSTILVPDKIPDSALKHAACFRAHHRFPILAWAGREGFGVLARSGAPLVGLLGKRSIQDEHLIGAFKESSPAGTLMIVDARPTINALASAVNGAGFEPLEHYAGCQRLFVNLENIHVIRRSFSQLILGDGEEWQAHIKKLLRATRTIVECLEQGMAVLVHCSDGWDRTGQLVSLAKICVDQHYRTTSGLADLIVEDWLTAGHKFSDRLCYHAPLLGCLGEGDGNGGYFMRLIKTTMGQKPSCHEEFSPIFPQFLDALGQLVRQAPDQFEYTLADLHRVCMEAMVNRNGLFTGNCEAERDPSVVVNLYELLGCDKKERVACDGQGVPTYPDSTLVDLETIFSIQ